MPHGVVVRALVYVNAADQYRVVITMLQHDIVPPISALHRCTTALLHCWSRIHGRVLTSPLEHPSVPHPPLPTLPTLPTLPILPTLTTLPTLPTLPVGQGW